MRSRISALHRARRRSAAGNYATARLPPTPPLRNSFRNRSGTWEPEIPFATRPPAEPPHSWRPRLLDRRVLRPRRRGTARLRGQHSAADLIELQGFEQRLEVALAEALVALALNDFKKTRAYQIFGKDLQQQTLSLRRRTIYENALLSQPIETLPVTRHPSLHCVVIRFWRVLKLHAPSAHAVHGRVDIIRAQRNMLDALSVVVSQKLLDLRFVILTLVERNANLPVGTRHCLREQTGQPPLDVEVSDLTKIEHVFVKPRPRSHVSAPHVVRKMIDVRQAYARCSLALRGARNRHEIDVVYLA